MAIPFIRTYFIIFLIEYIVLSFSNLYSKSLCYINILMVIHSTYVYFKSRNKQNYFDFDTIFLFILIIVGFVGPLFYKTDLQLLALGPFDFPERYFNRGITIFGIGVLSYLLGGLSNYKDNKKTIFVGYINATWIGYVMIVLCAIFMTGDLLNFYESLYAGDASEASSLLKFTDFLTWSIVAYLSICVYNSYFCGYSLKYSVYIPLIVVIGTSSIILLFGSRSLASYYLMPILAAYSTFYKPIKFKTFVLLFITLILLMKAIQFIRQGQVVYIGDSLSSINDLTICSMHTFWVQDYVATHGFSWGHNILIHVTAIIPGLSSFLYPKVDAGAAEILTKHIYSSTDVPGTAGLGVNIIADLYLTCGILSVIVGMFYLAKFVNYHQKRAAEGHLYSIVIFFVMMAYSAFICRTSYAQPSKAIVWSLIITWIAIHNTTKQKI